jgi:hypothetical protein
MHDGQHEPALSAYQEAALLKRLIEKLRPDFGYAWPRRGRVLAYYPQGSDREDGEGRPAVDVQLLRWGGEDWEPDDTIEILAAVEVPSALGSAAGHVSFYGVIEPGTDVDVGFYNGMYATPFILNVYAGEHWHPEDPNEGVTLSLNASTQLRIGQNGVVTLTASAVRIVQRANGEDEPGADSGTLVQIEQDRVIIEAPEILLGQGASKFIAREGDEIQIQLTPGALASIPPGGGQVPASPLTVKGVIVGCAAKARAE